MNNKLINFALSLTIIASFKASVATNNQPTPFNNPPQQSSKRDLFGAKQLILDNSDEYNNYLPQQKLIIATQFANRYGLTVQELENL